MSEERGSEGLAHLAKGKVELDATVSDTSTARQEAKQSLTSSSNNFRESEQRLVAYAAECRKHAANDTRCQELGWLCIPLAVETYGNWGKEAQSVFSWLASLLSISQAIPKPKMLSEIYSRLNMSLARSVARAIMGKEAVQG
ncbi:hypothetical protein EMCRGX_G006733 [Ephydatia muelleri]